jgi:hypothetical protein
MGLDPIDLAGLEAHFEEDEIWAAIKAMLSNKSLGPDGFSWDFYQCCWPVVKSNVLDAIQAVFLGRDQGFGGLNSALITLLAKVDCAVEVKDFRPISLVHSFGKLIAKLLATRLAPRMFELVHANQSAFIKGRCIEDNFVLVQQATRTLHQWKVPTLLLKLDVAKAFDNVSWAFLLSVLRQRGFGPRWIRWVLLLLSSSSTRVLINGRAGEAFLHDRGLRKGDPLSPLLFLIVMDVLVAMFRTAERVGVLADLSILRVKHRVSLRTTSLFYRGRTMTSFWFAKFCTSTMPRAPRRRSVALQPRLRRCLRVLHALSCNSPAPT